MKQNRRILDEYLISGSQFWNIGLNPNYVKSTLHFFALHRIIRSISSLEACLEGLSDRFAPSKRKLTVLFPNLVVDQNIWGGIFTKGIHEFILWYIHFTVASLLCIRLRCRKLAATKECEIIPPSWCVTIKNVTTNVLFLHLPECVNSKKPYAHYYTNEYS